MSSSAAAAPNRARIALWAIPTALYLLFAFWYTDFGGKLEPDEIDHFVAGLATTGAGPERIERFRRFLEEDTGRQFMMVNIMDFADDPPDVEGAEPGESSQSLMNRYMEHMFRELLKRACHPLVMGEAVYSAMDIVGIEGAERWDQAAYMRYRSRRSFAEIISNPDTLGRHTFKVAALDKTIAFPIEMRLYWSDLRFVLGLILVAGTSLADRVFFGRA